MTSLNPRPAGSIPRRQIRRLWRPLRRGVLAVFIVGLLLLAGGGDYRPTTVDLAAAPYRYNILAWELNHLPGGWLRRLAARWPGRATLTPPEQNAQAREFFALGQELRRWEQRRQLAGTAVQPPSIQELAALARLDARRREFRPAAEIAVEQAISQALTAQGITTSWGGVFPPVDVVFGGPPHLLMVSPRDRIYAQQSVLLRSDLNDTIKAEIEDELRRSDNLAALVEGTGGLSVYPSLALDTVGLRYALEITAHEWLHQWLFFRPLGRNFRASPEMLTLNETVASLAGAELGQQAYATITGTPPPGPPLSDPAAPPPDPPSSNSRRDVFDFTAEMRQTRRRTEELLAAGQIAAAEDYMEQRRQHFLTNGYYIRKLNQAYFAFHGSYATGPGSVSPIGGQLQELRRRSPSLKHFLEIVAQFSSYPEFLTYLERDGG